MIEKKCQLTKEQCDRLEDLRMGLIEEIKDDIIWQLKYI